MREFLLSIRSFDTQLHHFLALYGKHIYILLFVIIFVKTAYVIFTFLPGDATLFASGAIAALGHLDVRYLFVLFFISTIAGDMHNFYLGHLLNRAKNMKFKYSFTNFIPEKAVAKATRFLSKYGKLTIVLSRFIPLLAATVPFVSGFTGYRFKRFATYNLVGAFLWTSLWVTAGYCLGNVDWVAHHVTFMLTGITILTYLPPIFMLVYNAFKKRKNKSIYESNL